MKNQSVSMSEAHFCTLAELVPNLVFILRGGKVVYANRKLRIISGCCIRSSNLRDFDLITMFAEDCREAVVEDLNQSVAGITPAPRECRIMTCGGEELPALLELGSLGEKNHGETLGILTDISAQKRAEDEKRRLEDQAHLAAHLASIGEMASGIAHEINNPLTGVIGFAQLLSQRQIPDDIRDEVRIINEGAQRVAGIVRRLLTFARPRHPVREYTDINKLVLATLELQAYEFMSNDIEVVTDLAADLPRVLTDASQIQQVFLNITINALTEMKTKDPPNRLKVKTEISGKKVVIIFKDTGPGIKAENLKRIFDPFFTTREVGQGTGLGLSVCHGIVTQNEGRIYAESVYGQGATFTVELPVDLVDATEN